MVLLTFVVLGALLRLVAVVDLEPVRGCWRFSTLGFDSVGISEAVGVALSGVIGAEMAVSATGLVKVEVSEEEVNKSMTVFRLCRFSRTASSWVVSAAS